MANILELIYRDYLQKYKRQFLIVFLLILFIIAGAYAYKWYGTKHIDKKPYDDVANANFRNKPVSVLFFSTDWCPHCVKAKPQWQAFSDKYNNKEINGHKISCININCTDSDTPDVQSYIQKYNIEHYPTVKMLIDKDIVEFDASVTSENLGKLVDTVAK
jgi:thiol-disulfide isomerase/thioredoxin